MGIAQAVMTPAGDALYTVHMDHGKFASEWGIWEGLYYIAEGSFAFLGGVIAKYVGFSTLFVTMFILAFCAGLYIWLLPRDVL